MSGSKSKVDEEEENAEDEEMSSSVFLAERSSSIQIKHILSQSCQIEGSVSQTVSLETGNSTCLNNVPFRRKLVSTHAKDWW